MWAGRIESQVWMAMVISTMIFQTLKFSKRFQTCSDEINSQKKIKMHQNNELVTMKPNILTVV